MNQPASPVTPAYTTRAADVARDGDAVISIWHGNLGSSSRHESKLDWFYRDSPLGEPLVQLLRHEASASWIGTCAAGPRRMEWQGREICAGVLVDMAVTAQHRSLGPAIILQAALMERARGQYDLLYGFPNRKSLPVVKRIGYDVLGYMPRFTRVLHHRSYLERLGLRWAARPLAWLLDAIDGALGALRGRFNGPLHSEWLDRVDPRMDTLWQKSTHGTGPITIRDTTFLRWRFDDAPMATIRYFALSAPDGELLAWFACQCDDTTLQIRDFWSLEAAIRVRASYIRELIHAARRGSWSAVSVEHIGASGAMDSWITCGFRQRDQRPIIGRWMDPTTDHAATCFHLTAADEDE